MTYFCFKKTVLIGLLYTCFIDNLSNFPNHVIQVRKEYTSYIESITFGEKNSGCNLTSSSTIDLSNLLEISKLCF